MTPSRKAQIRRFFGLTAAIATSIQCTFGMYGQLAEVYRSGAGSLSVSLFLTGAFAMTCWAVWALFGDNDKIEWCALIPNSLGALGNAILSGVIIAGRWF